MTRTEEKLYVHSVFQAIDQAYQMKNQKPVANYEERLRASFNKLLVPDWYNHQYTTGHGLRKTKSQGHVPRVKRVNGDTNNNHNNNNNNNHQHHDETPDISVTSSLYSPHLSNGSHRASLRHRSPSRSWSERPPVRRDSTTSSYDTNTSIINGRRSVLSNGGSSYAPGVQRVAQSSAWYKPRAFTVQLAKPSIEPPKPFPRYSKMEQERFESADDLAPNSSKSIDRSVRCPIKPRVMAQAEEPPINISFEVDKTLVQEASTIEQHDDSFPSSDIPRADSIRSISSDAESYRSALLPSTEKNLLATDSSSYASVNERCLSPSTSSYHTAIAGDTTSSSSSTAGYETPTPQFDDGDDHATLSSHSSLSDLSHAETLEPNADDLDLAPAMSITLVEESSTKDVSTTDPEITTIHIDTDPSTTNISHPVDHQHWYDGSLETCIHKTNGSNQSEQSEIREISNDEDLREIDLNAVGDEFFLFSPAQNNDEESSASMTDSKSDQTSDSFPSPTQTAKRVFSMPNPMNTLYDSFHYSSSSDPFGFESNQSSSLMITNLDDMFMNDDDDQELLNATDQYFARTYRRPIQEDILYEVEHENSYSDHSQNTSSIVPIDDQVSIKVDPNTDFLTLADESLANSLPVISDQETSLPSDQQPSSTVNSEATTLPIYMLPPLYTTSGMKNTDSSMVSTSPATLHIETGDEHLQKWDALISQLTSPSLYTSKIRHRHYSVGSYYDHKSGNVPLHSNHTLYLLGSAPVSPLSRASTTSNDSHYHNSPISLTPLRRINPFIDANYDQHQSSIRRDEATRMTTRTYISPPLNIKPIATSLPFPLPSSLIETSATSNTNPTTVPSPSSIRTSSVPFQPYEIPATNSLSSSPPPPPPPPRTAPPLSQSTIDSPRKSPEKMFTRPQTTRTSHHNPPVPPRTITTERDSSQHVYQEIDRKSIPKRRSNPPNPDIQFIRAAIERVFDFRVGSTSDTTSDASTYYEEVSDNEGNSSVSSSTLLKKTNQYPAVEAIERFYKDKRIPVEPVTNLDDFPSSKSSNVNQIYSRSPPIVTIRMKLQTKSSDIERASSEEVDDTLNDIEDVDEHDDKKGRCQMPNGYKSNRTSQETQTIDQSRMMINQHQRRSHSPSPPVRTMVSPIDIVTEMIVEQEDVPETAVESEEMVIFYDDIEIVEHSSTSSYSSDSETESDSNSASNHYSRPNPAAPPIPARTLKPVSLMNQPTTNTKKIYELDRPTTNRKRFDVNSVNDMLNRTDQNIASSTSHRHPSARHFVGKLNNEDAALPPTKPITNGNHQRVPTKTFSSNGPARSSSTLPQGDLHRSIVADTNALVKQIQNSLSRNSLHDRQISSTLSTSSKDLHAFVSSTYSPSHENILDDREIQHRRIPSTVQDDQPFKRQARLSKSFHNVSEYNGNESQTNHQPAPLLNKGPPSKSVENDLDQVHPRRHRPNPIPLKLTSAVVGTSFSTLPLADDNHRLLSTKWFTGHVSENSEISYDKANVQADDLLYGYISTHGNQEIQKLFTRLQQSNDTSVHTALDDIRARVAEFDKYKKLEDLQMFMGYLERRLRGIHSNKSNPTSILTQTRITNGSSSDSPSADTLSLKSRSSSNGIKETNPTRQIGRQQQFRATQQTNGHHPVPPRRASQSSSNQENPIVVDESSTNGFGLPKKKNISLSYERPPPLVSTPLTTNTKAVHKVGRDIGKRLFESGTYKDPRLIYDGPKQVEKGEEPLETSV